MFTPSQEDVRRFFCSVYQKMQQRSPLEPLESLAAAWIAEHTEYNKDLADVDQAIASMKDLYITRENPFLHLSMHLSISEQCSIDQPKGLRKAVELLTDKKGDLHAAHHEVMHYLGKILQDSQTQGKPPDSEHYISLVMGAATKI